MIGKTNALNKGAKPEQAKAVEFYPGSNNSITITPNEGYVLSRAEVRKPSTMIPSNIKSGINIGGVTGTFEGGKPEQTKTVEFNPGSNDSMIITPDVGYVLNSVEVGKPSTMIPENIKSGIDIGGVTGTYVGADEANRSVKLLLDTTKSCYYMFNNYEGETIPDGVLKFSDTSNVTDMRYMFNWCSNLTTIPQLDTSNVTRTDLMFYRCKKLITIPQLNTSKVTYMDRMFDYCYKLTNIPQLDTSSVTNMYRMFEHCESLTTIPLLDLNKVTDASYIFDSCYNLTNLTILNIKINLQIGSGTSSGSLLTIDSLVNTCKECIKQSASRTLTVGSANLTKLANVYVKFTDPSQTEIAVGEKGDIVVCESTDEGAMLISDYMTLKSWTLA